MKVGLGENEIVWERFGKYGYDALFEELKLILKTEKENALARLPRKASERLGKLGACSSALEEVEHVSNLQISPAGETRDRSSCTHISF